MIDNIGKLTFNQEQWWIVIQGYQNVFILLAIGFCWHFLPNRVILMMQKAFDATPLLIKAIILAFFFWIVYATSLAGPQPFIYFQF